MIETPRLHLIPFEVEHAAALQSGSSKLGSLLGVSVAEGWPHFPEAYAVERLRTEADRDPASGVGGTYLFLSKDHPWLVGSGGYKGEPSRGIVEVGYEIAPDFQNRGLATEATRAMADHAFSHSTVQFVQAHTLPEPNASTRVLEKVGMALVEKVEDPGEGVVWRWVVARADWPAPA